MLLFAKYTINHLGGIITVQNLNVTNIGFYEINSINKFEKSGLYLKYQQ